MQPQSHRLKGTTQRLVLAVGLVGLVPVATGLVRRNIHGNLHFHRLCNRHSLAIRSYEPNRNYHRRHRNTPANLHFHRFCNQHSPLLRKFESTHSQLWPQECS